MKNIMIKSAIATAVIAATTATAVADVKLYGRLNIRAACQDDGAGGTDECRVSNNGSRFGIKANSEVSDGLTAFGKYEFATDIDNGGSGETTRLAFVGLKGGFGEVSLGTRWNPIYSHTVSPIDYPNQFGGTSASYGVASPFRTTDTINYKNKFGAASVGVQIQMTDGGDDVDQSTIGASFKAGSSTLGLAYQTENNDGDDDITSVHARTKLGAFAVGATWLKAGDDDGILVNGNYGMGGGKSINLSYGTNDDGDSIGLEYLHKMGGGFRFYGGFETNRADDSNVGGDDFNQYGVGFRYDF